MKTTEETQAELAAANAMIEKLKRQLRLALEEVARLTEKV